MNKRHIFITLICTFFGLVGYYSLKSSPMPKTGFTWSFMDSITSLDPAKMHWLDENIVAMALWEGLTTLHPEDQSIIPGVAYLPPDINRDQTTYVFKLRPEAKWSNGDPVTAHDFIYGWRRAIEPGSSGVYIGFITDHIAGAKEYSDWRNQAVKTIQCLDDLINEKELSNEDKRFIDRQLNINCDKEFNSQAIDKEDRKKKIRSIQSTFRANHLNEMEQRFSNVGLLALNDHTLQIKLTRPIPYLLQLLSNQTFMPVHQGIESLKTIQPTTVWDFDNHWVKPNYQKDAYNGIVTNGPFKLTDWQFKRFMHFEKNPYYWDKNNVKSDSCTIRIIRDASTMFLTYESGALDVCTDITRLEFAPTLAELSNNGQRKDINVTTAFATYYYIFNCQETLNDGRDNPFKDPRVRLAFNLALDKEAIANNVVKLGNKPARNFVPINSIPGYSSPPGPDYNIQRARQLLAEAGYPDGKNLPTIEIKYNTGASHGKIAQAINEMWRQNLGVKTSLTGKEVKSFNEDKNTQNFMIIRAGWYGDYTDPTTFLDLLHTDNGNNDGKYSNPKYDALLAKAAATIDPQERYKTLSQAESLLMMEDLPILPIYFYVNITGFRDNVKGVYANARDLYPFKHIFIDK